MHRRRDIIKFRERINGKAVQVKYYMCGSNDDLMMSTKPCDAPIVQEVKEPTIENKTNGEGLVIETKKQPKMRKKPMPINNPIEIKTPEIQNNETAISDGGCTPIIPNRELILKELNKSSYLNQKLRKQKQKGGSIIML